MENKYTKGQILDSEEYKKIRDVVNALFDDEPLTKKQIDKKINDYLKGKVR